MPTAGQLRELVELVRLDRAPDGEGGWIEVPMEVQRRHARVREVRYVTPVVADGATVQYTHEVELRDSPAIDPEAVDRVRIGGRDHDVVGAVRDPARRTVTLFVRRSGRDA